uniref:uncharacterized protein n=1 Tax=Myxine glutinosa TaxID=7769 RepID=UPI00358F33D8
MMVRTYKRKTERGNYGQSNLSAALTAVSEGLPLIRASKDFGVPARRPTLRRHRDQQVAAPGVLNFGRYKNALPPEIDAQLKAHVTEMQRRLYGLRMRDMQRLAFDVAEKAQISHPFNRESRMAGKDWVQNFLSRHDLTLRQPQATSIARVVGFNKPRVQGFFDLFKECLTAEDYTPSRVWNMDETGLTTVQKPGKVMATKGARQASSEEEDWPCLICCEEYSRARPREVCVQCQLCLHWAHEQCMPGLAQFLCPNCESDVSD